MPSYIQTRPFYPTKSHLCSVQFSGVELQSFTLQLPGFLHLATFAVLVVCTKNVSAPTQTGGRDLAGMTPFLLKLTQILQACREWQLGVSAFFFPLRAAVSATHALSSSGSYLTVSQIVTQECGYSGLSFTATGAEPLLLFTSNV